MKRQLEMVSEFHEKHNAAVQPIEELLGAPYIPSNIGRLAYALCNEASCGWDFKDPIQLRAQLMTEELGEFLKAVWERDLAGACDGLVDLLYVVLGTAVQLDIPVVELFEEVHRANMEKKGGSTDPRVLNKGTDWQPPRIIEIFKETRDARTKSRVSDPGCRDVDSA